MYEEYLIPIKCYTGDTAGDQIVTIFELYIKRIKKKIQETTRSICDPLCEKQPYSRGE